ncbi:maleylpyruvate isomerase N-terminal domain-containing protein [Streptomyces sp. NPDC047869]|uniref:maleylpyruvate isomerase N-terminal domain-containing protein n=1 Tax=Streptomyces sp. NPDC047869 TaxID=3154709 RepID=UPI0034549FD9
MRTVVDLAADPAVAAAWNEPGVLKDFSVRGLVGHMFWQELALPGMLSDPVPAEPVVSLREYYLQRVTWLDAGAHGAVSVRIRQGGEATAADGHEALLAGVREAVGRLRTQVPDAPAVRPVRVSSTQRIPQDKHQQLVLLQTAHSHRGTRVRPTSTRKASATPLRCDVTASTVQPSPACLRPPRDSLTRRRGRREDAGGRWVWAAARVVGRSWGQPASARPCARSSVRPRWSGRSSRPTCLRAPGCRVPGSACACRCAPSTPSSAGSSGGRAAPNRAAAPRDDVSPGGCPTGTAKAC